MLSDQSTKYVCGRTESKIYGTHKYLHRVSKMKGIIIHY